MSKIQEVGDQVGAAMLGLPLEVAGQALDKFNAAQELLGRLTTGAQSETATTLMNNIQLASEKLEAAMSRMQTARESASTYLSAIGLSGMLSEGDLMSSPPLVSEEEAKATKNYNPAYRRRAVIANIASRQKNLQNRQQAPGWIGERECLRDLLFAPVADEPLSRKLANKMVGTKVPSSRGPTIVKITARVHRILSEHNENARNAQADALFCIVGDENLRFVADVTGLVISYWRYALEGSSSLEPFPMVANTRGRWRRPDFRRKDERLVVEVASAVSELRQFGYGPQLPRRQLAAAIALNDPETLKQWTAERTVRDYCAQHDVAADRVLPYLGRDILAKLYTNSPTNPKAGLARAVERLSGPLSIEGIAERTGWTKDKVEHYFLPAIIAHAATDNVDAGKFVTGFAKRVDARLESSSDQG